MLKYNEKNCPLIIQKVVPVLYPFQFPVIGFDSHKEPRSGPENPFVLDM